MGNDHDDNAGVGFRRPPTWAQFRPGESGNPKGRPRRKEPTVQVVTGAELTEFNKCISDLLNEKVLLTLNGTKASITKMNAFVLRYFKEAMTGNPHAMRDWARLIEKLEVKEQEKRAAQAEAAKRAAKTKADQDAARYSYLVELKRNQAKLWEDAAAAGKVEPDLPWPHPDDILIDHGTHTGRVRGPVDAEDLPQWEYLRRIRDHFLARMVLAMYTDEPEGDFLTKIYLAALINDDVHLPRRWQISHDLSPHTLKLIALPLHRLEAIVATGAAEFETKKPGERRSKETYAHHNRLWGPMLRLLGYKSLRHFERENESIDQR